MVKLRDAIELTKNKAVKDNRYTDLFGKSELEKPSYQKSWRVENCSEVWSVRQAIMNGAVWDNISFRCIDIRTDMNNRHAQIVRLHLKNYMR